MSRVIENAEVMRMPPNKRPRYEDGSPIRAHQPPVAIESPKPTPQPVVVAPDMSQVVAAIRELGDRPDGMGQIVAAIQGLKAEPAKCRTYEFTVTARDDYGKVLRFTVTEKE